MEWARIEGIFGSHLVNPPLLKAVLTSGKIAQDLVQENFEYYQGWKSHDLFVSLFLFLPSLLMFWLVFFFPFACRCSLLWCKFRGLPLGLFPVHC